jgi:hypothetical protein
LNVFKSKSGVASLLPTFCCIISSDAGRASIRRRGRVLPNRRCHAPFPSCHSGGVGPAWSTKRSATRERPDASTTVLNYKTFWLNFLATLLLLYISRHSVYLNA